MKSRGDSYLLPNEYFEKQKYEMPNDDLTFAFLQTMRIQLDALFHKCCFSMFHHLHILTTHNLYWNQPIM